MDDLELDRRIRALVATAQDDAPMAHRWHPAAPRRNRTAGFLAAAAAVAVLGLMGFALVRGLAGSESKDSASSGTLGTDTTAAGAAAETTTGDTSASETTGVSASTTGGATDTTSPAACTSGEATPGGYGTVVPDTQPIVVDLSVVPASACPGGTIRLSFLVDNTAGTAQFVFPQPEVLLVAGNGLRWSLGTVQGVSLAPGTSITIDGVFVVPQVPEGIYQITVRGLDAASTTLEVRSTPP